MYKKNVTECFGKFNRQNEECLGCQGKFLCMEKAGTLVKECFGRYISDKECCKACEDVPLCIEDQEEAFWQRW